MVDELCKCFLSKVMTVLSSRDGISRRPNFGGPPRRPPLDLNLKTFFGVTRDLVETVGEENSLIRIISQMIAKCPIHYSGKREMA